MKDTAQPKRLMHRTEVAHATSGTGSKAMRALCVVLHWPNSNSGMLPIQLHLREQPGLASAVAPFFLPANIVQRANQYTVTMRNCFNNIITLTQLYPHYMLIRACISMRALFNRLSFSHQ